MNGRTRGCWKPKGSTRESLSRASFTICAAPDPIATRAQKILSGLLLEINLFDIIQIVENSRLSGALLIMSSVADGEIHFDEGQMIGAKTGGDMGAPG